MTRTTTLLSALFDGGTRLLRDAAAPCRAACVVLAAALAPMPPAAALPMPPVAATRMPPVAAPVPPPPPEQEADVRPEVVAARAELAEAADRLDEAFEALEGLVRDLHDDYETLVSDRSARDELVLVMADSLEAAATRVVAAEAQGRRVVRSTRRAILEEVFESPVRQAAPVDARLALWLAGRVADGLASRRDLDEVTTEDVRKHVEGAFQPDESWYDFWNRTFHEGLPEATTYAAARRHHEAATLALDRLLHPERYGPRGEPAPEGMVVVPGGTYALGPGSGWPREARRVTLPPFLIDRHEVTAGAYADFVNGRPRGERPALLPGGWSLDGDGTVQVEPERARHPVAWVSWSQAAAYAASLGKRLPTEDEWEAAAAGTGGRAYPWGNVWREDAAQSNARDTAPVESYPDAVSPAGCLDMAGNVWEWTATRDDGRDVDRVGEGFVSMVIRGGGFASPRHELTTRYRWTAPAHEGHLDPAVDRPIGFRCARDL